LLLPLIVFADDGQNMKKSKNVIELLLSAKYVVGFILALIGIGLIWANKLNNGTRIPYLLIAFFLFAVFALLHEIIPFATGFGLHPSPVCAITKPFIYGLKKPFLTALIFMGILSLITTKGFCGTICPAGALQELLYKIPAFKKIKRKKVSFVISNTIRIIIFVLFLVLIFTIGFNIYGYLSLFELFHWYFAIPFFDLILFIVIIGAMLVASLFSFRPFCYFVCPIGLATWIFEQLSILKIRINMDKCTDCDVCKVISPCNAVGDLVDGKKIISDCHICGSCLEDCPENAFYFGLKKNL
jgi:polyferredoxin